MTKNSRVTHITSHYSMKFGQVQKRIAENACFVWVVYGETFRDATFAEAAAMRKAEVKPIPSPVGLGKSGEVPGCFFRVPVMARSRTSAGKRLSRASGSLLGASFHLQHDASPNQPAITLINNTLQEIANQFCLEHA